MSSTRSKDHLGVLLIVLGFVTCMLGVQIYIFVTTDYYDEVQSNEIECAPKPQEWYGKTTRTILV